MVLSLGHNDDALIFARALRDTGIPVSAIAMRLIIKIGKNVGQHPLAVCLYRVLAGPPVLGVVLSAA